MVVCDEGATSQFALTSLSKASGVITKRECLITIMNASLFGFEYIKDLYEHDGDFGKIYEGFLEKKV